MSLDANTTFILFVMLLVLLNVGIIWIEHTRPKGPPAVPTHKRKRHH